MRNSWLFVVAVLFSPALVAERVPGRYIVELSTEPVADHVARLHVGGKMRSSAALSHRAAIRAEQQSIQRQLEQRNALVLDRTDTVANALFVEVPDDAAAQLATVPGVKHVWPVRTFHMVLDRAVVLHKVVDAWNQIGSDRAGAGVKIAIIDTGIDSGHPGFQDPSLAMPAAFPLVNNASDLVYTNNKVIVARSYVNLLPNRDPDTSARDRVGHGTALAMVAAGVQNTGPLASITGVAPKAYLGNYKVFGTPGFNDSASDAAILKAMDDAVADGMDIINLSLGDPLAPRFSDDLDAQAVERASEAGVIVVVAAGNAGPDLNTMSSPASAPSAIAAGASTNDRTFAASAQVDGLSPFVAILGDGPTRAAPITGPVTDVTALDGNGQACSALPADSLKNRVALILRGVCTFESKLNNAQRAGAAGALVYAAADSPDPIPMAVGAATLPAVMIGNGDGVAIQQSLASQPSLNATLNFTLSAVPMVPNLLADFSGVGPNVDAGIKPDMLAVGSDIYVATQKFDSGGEMYDPSGYILVDGTSFSSPLVAGAAALIKSARPGLSVDQYRSLLINAAAPSGQTLSVQQTGAGLLDANAAFNSTIAAYPTSLSFGFGASSAQVGRTVTITNLGTTQETFTVTAAARTGAVTPAIGTGTLQLDAGASADVPVSWNTTALAAGTYDGYVTITAASSGIQAKVPYWYAATSGVPARITVLDSLTSGRRGSSQPDAILFRITDSTGLDLTNAQPRATVVSGGGAVRSVVSHDADVPGVYGVTVQLGVAAGTNVFHIEAGGVSVDVPISGQ